MFSFAPFIWVSLCILSILSHFLKIISITPRHGRKSDSGLMCIHFAKPLIRHPFRGCPFTVSYSLLSLTAIKKQVTAVNFVLHSFLQSGTVRPDSGSQTLVSWQFVAPSIIQHYGSVVRNEWASKFNRTQQIKPVRAVPDKGNRQIQ